MTNFSETTQKTTIWPLLALLLGTSALAFAPIFVKLTETSATITTFWRMFLSTPILAFAWILFPNKQWVQKTKNQFKDYLVIVLAGLFFALDLVFWNLSLEHTSVANATLLVNCASFFVAFISWWLFKKPMSFKLFLGILVAFIGGFLLVWPHFDTQDTSLWGDFLSLIAALFYALYIITIQIARQRFGTLSIMTVSGVVTTLAALFIAWVLNESLMADFSSSWQALMGLALIVQILGQGFIAYALATVNAALSAVILLLQPVMSAWIAWYLFGENLVVIQGIGMVVILIGIGLAKIGSVKQ